MIQYDDCAACGGTGKNSRGFQCSACWTRRLNNPTSRREVKRDDTERKKAELMGIIRMLQPKKEETPEDRVARLKEEMESLLRGLTQ